MKPPLIECDKCEGAGTVPLSPEMVATLAAVKPYRGQTAIELLAVLGHHVTVNAINNRLEDLRRNGLVHRERRGKFWLYFRTTSKK